MTPPEIESNSTYCNIVQKTPLSHPNSKIQVLRNDGDEYQLSAELDDHK